LANRPPMMSAWATIVGGPHTTRGRVRPAGLGSCDVGSAGLQRDGRFLGPALSQGLRLRTPAACRPRSGSLFSASPSWRHRKKKCRHYNARGCSTSRCPSWPRPVNVPWRADIAVGHHTTLRLGSDAPPCKGPCARRPADWPQRRVPAPFPSMI